MIARRLLGLLLVAAVAAGCAGESPGDGGSARLVVTRDRGAQVMVDTTVASGQTLMRALRSTADVETRYGGRYVQSIDGIEGSLRRREDWFWLVNGLVGDRSAAAYRLHDGDVAWWDHRNWTGDADTLEAVVGLFPEPFRHGFDGHRRSAVVRYAAGLRAAAERVGGAIGATDVAPRGATVPDDANLFELERGRERFEARLRSPGSGPSSPVRFTFAGSVDRLLDGGYALRFAVP